MKFQPAPGDEIAIRGIYTEHFPAGQRYGAGGHMVAMDRSQNVITASDQLFAPWRSFEQIEAAKAVCKAVREHIEDYFGVSGWRQASPPFAWKEMFAALARWEAANH